MSRRVDKVLIDAETTQDVAGYLYVMDCAQCNEFGFDIEFDHTSAAGTVLIETAADETYTGTWAVLSTTNWSAIDKSIHVAVAGSYRVIRARISSAITTGTVTVRATGNGNPT